MEYVRFGEMYSIPSSNGVSRPSAVRGKGYKMINMGELFSNDIISDMPMEKVELSPKEKKKFLVQKNDLLFARQSLVASGAGKCSIIKQLREETTFESHIIRVRLNEAKCNPWYYYYLFQLPYNPIKTIVNQCAQAGIRGKELLRMKVPFLQVTEQNKIVNILFQYDTLIENNNKRIMLLEQIAENLYKEWFVRFRFPNHSNCKFVKNVPENWREGQLSDLCNFVRGKNITNEQMVPGEYEVVSAGLEPSGYHNKANVKGISITVSASGANAGYVSFHQRDIWAADCSYISSQNAKNIFYLYGLINSLRPIITSLQIGSAQPHVYPKQLNKIKILIPPEQLIELGNEKLGVIYKQIEIFTQQNQNLIKQRDMLLPRLMSGKLQVK